MLDLGDSQITYRARYLASLPPLVDDGMMEKPRRLHMRLASDLSTASAADLDPKRIFIIEQNLLSLAEAIAARYFQHGPNAARVAKNAGLA